MASSESRSEVVLALAEEFLERYRKGERPPLKEYIDRHPTLAAEIKDVFPAMAMMENIALGNESQGGTTNRYRQPDGKPWAMLTQLGDYRILREIGKGGMGVVFEAEQISLGRHVALKVLPNTMLLSEKQKRRFEREAKAAAKLHHTNIVPVFGVGEHEGLPYYAMQFIQGLGLDMVLEELRNLQGNAAEAFKSGLTPPMPASRTDARVAEMAKSLMTCQFQVGGNEATPGDATIDQPSPQGSGSGSTVRSPGSLSSASVLLPGQGSASQARHGAYWRSVAQIGVQVADALDYAHKQGIIHRDIKPSNLLLDTHGIVWVTDFGLAKAADQDDLTQTGDILGTLRYMPPEAFEGKVDARADIYALGLTLYEMLTLRPAFGETDRNKLIKQVTSAEPERLDRSLPGMPRDLATIVHKAIDREPARRYGTAGELRDDLQRYLNGEPIQARRVSELERVWKAARRHPFVAGLAAALVGAMIVGTAASTYFAFEAWGQERLARDAQGFAQRQEKAAREEAEHAKTAEAAANRQLAKAHFERGLGLCEEGQAALGLHWFLASLKVAPPEDREFRHTVRLNLAAWMDAVPALKEVLHDDGFGSSAFSPDGTTLATANRQTVHIWDTQTGKSIRTLAHQEPVRIGCFSPDANILCTIGLRPATNSCVAYFWDPATGDLTDKLTIPGDVWAAMFTPDGDRLVTGTDLGPNQGELRVWNARTRQPIGQPIPQPAAVRRIYLLADRKTLLTQSLSGQGANFYQLNDLNTGARITNPHVTPLGAHVFLPADHSILFHEERWHLAHHVLKLRWREFPSGTEREATPPTRGAGNTFLGPVSPDGQTCWFGSSAGRVDWRDVATGRLRASFRAGAAAVQADACSGRQLVTGTHSAPVRLWDMPRLAVPFAEPAADPSASERATKTGFACCTFSADGTRALFGGRGNGDNLTPGLCRLVDTTTGQPIGPPLQLPGLAVRAVAFSPDGNTVATAYHPREVGGGVQLWDAHTGKPLLNIPLTNYASAVAFSPDSKLLATGDYHQLVKLWDVATGKPVGLPLFHKNVILCVAFAPDGQTLAAGTADDRDSPPGARLWNVVTGKPIGELMPTRGRAYRVTFSRDGRQLYTVNGDGVIHRWDAATAAPLGELPIDVAGSLSMNGFQDGIPFSPDGKTFLTGNVDGTARLWDVSTAKPIRAAVFTHPAVVKAAAYRPDGKMAAIGCEDGTVRLWDLTTYQPIGPPLTMRRPIVGVSFTSNGRTVSAADRSGRCQTWPVPTVADNTDVARLALRLQVRTGLYLDADFEAAFLAPAEWRKQRDKLVRLEGSTQIACDFRLDEVAWHQACAADAEEDGKSLAALWHLDRLIALRPADWLPYARKAHQHVLGNQLGDAEAAYQAARKHTVGAQLVHWQHQKAAECQTAKQYAVALWYLDHVQSGAPKEWTVQRDRADVLKELGKTADSEAALAKAVEFGADAPLVMRQVEVLARKGQWSSAAGLLAKLHQQAPESPRLTHLYALALLHSDDAVGYRRVCTDLLTKATKTKVSPAAANSIAWTCAVGPDAAGDLSEAVRLAERAAAAATPEARHAVLNTLGAVLYRAGRHQDAINRLNDAITAHGGDGVNQDWLFLAMAHHRLGQMNEAKKWYARALSTEPPANEPFWVNAEKTLLKREAKVLIDGKDHQR